MNDGTDELLEVSRWQREAVARTKVQTIDDDVPGRAWIPFAVEELLRLVATTIFVCMVLAWAAILST